MNAPSGSLEGAARRRPGRRWPRRLALLGGILAAIPLVIIGYQKTLRVAGNLHTVVPGELYRSAQPTPERLRRYVADEGIRTVVNLRGSQPGVGWYEDERATLQDLHVAMVDFSMSAETILTPDRARELIATLSTAQKPILIHCLDGADRSGLASVIYASQVAGEDEETAEYQLNPLYGHFGIPIFSPTYAMDQSWELLEPMFGIFDS